MKSEEKHKLTSILTDERNCKAIFSMLMQWTAMCMSTIRTLS